MPRKVDHQERREHIGAAVLHLIATRGLAAASLRNVAAQAQVSMGAVQHYFTTTQDMLAFALQYNYERATRRIPKLFAAAPPPDSTRATLRILLVDLLSLDGESRDGARLGAAILARAVVDPQVAHAASTAYTGATDLLAHQLRTAQHNGELAGDTDPDHAARYLYAVVEGLRWPTLIGAYTPDQALAVLDGHLNQLLPDPH